MSKLRLTLKIIDLDTGKIDYERECRSWDIQFLQMLYFVMSNYTLTNQIKDATGTLRTLSAPARNDIPRGQFIAAGSGVEAYGIILGTGVGAESALDYQVGTIINHGVAGGNLFYGDTGGTTGYEFPAGGQFEIHRNFSNVSGGAITINEVCIYGYYTTGANNWYFCFCRDVIAGGEAVADGTNKQVRFTISVDN